MGANLKKIFETTPIIRGPEYDEVLRKLHDEQTKAARMIKRTMHARRYLINFKRTGAKRGKFPSLKDL
jgi:hypothetical protein